jgi:RimJ/RimL family protein N-acetyltransferase
MKPARGSDRPIFVRLPGRRSLLFHADAFVAQFVKAQVGRLPPNAGWQLYRAIGVMLDEELVGGVVFHDYRWEAGDIEITAAFSTPAWCSKAAFRGILFYPLHTLKLQRCTARTAESNTQARDFLTRLGFREEGRLRRAFDGKEDVMIYGVLREELMKGLD